MVVHNFFTSNVGGKSQNTGILGHFGLGRPFSPRNIFSPKVRIFFTFYVLADRTPKGGKSQNTGVLGHFGIRRALVLKETPGGKQKNTNSLIETEVREEKPLQLGPNNQS